MQHQTVDKPTWAMSKRERTNAERQSQGLPRLPRHKWPWFVLVLLIGAGVAWYVLQGANGVASSEVASTQGQEETVLRMEINALEYETVEPGDVVRTVRVTGTLRPVDEATVSGPVGGRVLSVPVRVGDTVKEGDVLAQLDAEPLEIARNLQASTAQSTQAQLSLAQSQRERTDALFARGSASEAQRDQASIEAQTLEAQLAAQRDSLAAAELDLRNATIRSPIDGAVTERSINPGATIAAGAAVATVSDLSTVEMEAQVPVANGASLRAGQEVGVSVDGLREAYTGTITRINPVASSDSRALTLFVRLDNTEGALLGGMYATGDIAVEVRPNAITLPKEAIRTENEQPYVMVVEEGVLVERPVSIIANWSQESSLVEEGLEAGDIVVNAALPELVAGDAVVLMK